MKGGKKDCSFQNSNIFPLLLNLTTLKALGSFSNFKIIEEKGLLRQFAIRHYQTQVLRAES